MKLVGFNIRTDFERIFPEENSPDFLERLDWNLKNLSKETMEKDDYCAAFLYFGYKKKEYKLIEFSKEDRERGLNDKFHFFVLWLILCLKRPWQKNWKWSIDEEDKDKASDILDKFLEKFPYLPDLQTLRWHKKKERFKECVAEAMLLPMLSKLEEAFKACYGEIFKKLKPALYPTVFEFVREIVSEKYYIKRDLYRKLRINVKDCDLLLKWAKAKSLIKLKKLSNNSVLIIYNERLSKNIKVKN